MEHEIDKTTELALTWAWDICTQHSTPKVNPADVSDWPRFQETYDFCRAMIVDTLKRENDGKQRDRQ